MRTTNHALLYVFYDRCSCLNGAACNRTNGACECAKGWFGENCQFPCPNGYYGQDCKYSCHIKSSETRKTCDSVNGHVSCIAGFHGPHCKSECDPFLYGEDCVFHCSCNKEHTDKCDSQKGICICKAGYQGEK